MPETNLEMASGHVTRQELLITSQHALISKLRAGGLQAEDEENFLSQLYDVLAMHQRAPRRRS